MSARTARNTYYVVNLIYLNMGTSDCSLFNKLKVLMRNIWICIIFNHSVFIIHSKLLKCTLLLVIRIVMTFDVST